MSLGLKRKTVKLEPHDAAWEISAQQVIHTLKGILQEDARDIQHIGSTSIKTIMAKPIVDIAVGVEKLEDMRKHDRQLEKGGFLFRGEDVKGQLLYVLGDTANDIRTHHIHVVLWGREDWRHYLLFRDYLNCHEEEAGAYSSLKKALCEKYPNDRGSYTQNKQTMIDEILINAERWEKENEKTPFARQRPKQTDF
ncbi:MAG: GrpB family protein [Provencibacterium sp.]|nr:GrpB family protein [Provencibacterium sp.]